MRDLFNHRGRLSRLRYFVRIVTTVVVAGIIGVGGVALMVTEQNVAFIVGVIIMGATAILAGVIGAMLTIRRLHDQDLSGWWCLILYAVRATSDQMTIKEGLFIRVARLRQLAQGAVLAQLGGGQR